MSLHGKKMNLFKIIKKASFLSLILLIGLLLCSCSNQSNDLRRASASEPFKEAKVLKLSIESKIFNRKMPCMIYLPKGYGNGKEYPVWYGLHGHSSNETMWIDNGIAETADKLIADGEIKPLIMVFPFVKDADVKEIAEDKADDGKFSERKIDQYISKELVPYIDSHYYSNASRNSRFIGGLSMGGMISLRVAFHHADLFSKVGGYTPAMISKDYSNNQLEEWLYPNDKFDQSIDILAFDKKKGFDKLKIYIDTGNSNDPFSEGNQSLNKALLKRKIDIEFRLYNGGHSLQTDFIEDYLKFYVKKY